MVTMALKGHLQHGGVLLLGEGDFSFTRSLVECVDNNQIVTTSFQSEDCVASHHKSALENIEYIKSKGVTVLFNVDATKIHQMDTLCMHPWHCVVFNFPHVGGKSNIKKNKKLLKDFFSSASQIIHPCGKVIVTLCKGQGGTSYDRPVRAWHDSWQVVAMASNSRLILNEVQPFNMEDYPVYSSTGYRSQDRGFHTHNALTHIFVRSSPLEPYPGTAGTEKQLIEIDGEKFMCPAYLVRRLNRQLHRTDYHPVCTVRERIENAAKTNFNDVLICSEEKPFSVVVRVFESHEISASNDVAKRGGEDLFSLERAYRLETARCSEHLSRSAFVRDGVVVLRPSLLCNLDQVTDVTLNHSVALLTGQVFQRCPIGVTKLPVCHEMLVVTSMEKIRNADEDSQKSDLEVIKTFIACLQLNASVEECSFFGKMIFPPHLNLLDKQGSQVKFSALLRSSTDRSCVGKVFTIVNSQSKWDVILLLDLDSIASVTYGIMDLRQLWSTDERFLDQFRTPSTNVCFTPYSVCYKPYSMDVSFWTSPRFSEEKLCDILRDVVDDYIESTELIDEYTNSEGEKSLCYRLVFSACSQALSYDDMYTYYQSARSCLPHLLDVVLR